MTPLTKLAKILKTELAASNWTDAGFKRYLANTGWMAFARFFMLVISFFVTIQVIRYLGPYNYGLLSYALSFVGMFGFIATVGVDMIVYRELIKNPAHESKIMGSALLLRLIGGAIATSLAVCAGFLFHQNTIDQMLILLIALVHFGGAWQIIAYSFQARVLSKYPAIITLATAVTLAIAKISIIFFGKGIIYFALVLVLESLLYAILYVVFYTRHINSIRTWQVDTATMRTLFYTSLPLLLSTVSILIYTRIDQVMLRHYLDATAVGIYDAAVRLSDVWYIIPNILLGALFPAIVNAQKNGRNTYRARLKHLAALLFILSVLIAIPTTIFADTIVSILYGNSYAESSGVLIIYIWSVAGFSLGQLMNLFLIAENYTGIYFVSSIVTLLVNVGLNLVFIPLWGLNGAAFATLISYSLIAVVPFAYPKIRHTLLDKKPVAV